MGYQYITLIVLPITCHIKCTTLELHQNFPCDIYTEQFSQYVTRGNALLVLQPTDGAIPRSDGYINPQLTGNETNVSGRLQLKFDGLA